MSILSPAPLAYWLRYLSRVSTVGRHVQPAPAKKPERACHVSPRSICTGELMSLTNPDGRIELSGATICVFVVTVSLVYFSPDSSAVKRSALRDGAPMPKPQRSPLVSSTSLGLPRTMKPP